MNDHVGGFPEGRRPALGHAWFSNASIAVLFAVCAFATMLLARSVQSALEAHGQEMHETQARELIHLIQDRLQDYELVLKGARATATLSPDLDRAFWRSYVERLDLQRQYPGVLGISVAPLVPADVRHAALERLRAKWGPDFAIWPAPRGVSAPVACMEPMDEANRRAIGFDLFSEQTRREALERAAETGATTITGQLRLVQDAGGQERDGFLMCLPVYAPGAPVFTQQERRRALVGFVTSAFRMRDFMRSLEARSPKAAGFRLYDGGRDDADRLYFASANLDELAQGEGTVESVRTFEVFGRSWTLRIFTQHYADTAFERHAGTLVMAGGLSISLLLALVLLSQRHTRARAEGLARSMTAALRESKERYKAFFSSAESVRLIADPEDGRIVDANEAAVQFYGYGQALKGMHVTDINTLPRERTLEELRQAAAMAKNLFRFRHRLASGELRDVEVHTSTIQVEGRRLVASSIHDVTELRRLERIRSDVELIMRHDLKAPLSAFITLPKLLSEDARLCAEHRDALLVLHHTASRMMQNINATLALQKIESGDYAPAVGECRPVQAVLHNVELLAVCRNVARGRVRVTPGEDGFVVHTDPVLFDIVLMNILTNALEAGGADDPVRVEVRREGGLAEVSVWNPRAVPQDMRSRFFERYATFGKVGGTGMGTYSARLMARAMGGSVDMETSEEGGTRVTLRVPDRGPANGPAGSPEG